MATSGSTRTSIKLMPDSTITKPGLWQKVLHRRKGSIMRRLLPPQQNGYHPDTLFLAAQNRWKVHQMVVKTTFLNGDIKENIFMSQPEGFVVKGHHIKYANL